MSSRRNFTNLHNNPHIDIPDFIVVYDLRLAEKELKAASQKSFRRQDETPKKKYVSRFLIIAEAVLAQIDSPETENLRPSSIECKMSHYLN